MACFLKLVARILKSEPLIFSCSHAGLRAENQFSFSGHGKQTISTVIVTTVETRFIASENPHPAPPPPAACETGGRRICTPPPLPPGLITIIAKLQCFFSMTSSRCRASRTFRRGARTRAWSGLCRPATCGGGFHALSAPFWLCRLLPRGPSWPLRTCFMAQMCRWCMSSTPATDFISFMIRSGSTPSGMLSSERRRLCDSRCHVEARITPTITRLITGSIMYQPAKGNGYSPKPPRLSTRVCRPPCGGTRPRR